MKGSNVVCGMGVVAVIGSSIGVVSSGGTRGGG